MLRGPSPGRKARPGIVKHPVLRSALDHLRRAARSAVQVAYAKRSGGRALERILWSLPPCYSKKGNAGILLTCRQDARVPFRVLPNHP
jgi:hypothetical protein